MLHRCSSVSVLALLTLAACKPSGASTDPSAAPVSDASEPATGEAPIGPPVRFASVGVPHAGTISAVALDPTGRAALTRDSVGGVRLWAALDGSREPVVVPIRDPHAMALAVHPQGWTLALVDGAGGARIVAVDDAGTNMQALVSLPPTDPLATLQVLPGGDRLVAIGQDHVIRLLARDGHELARLDLPGKRPASLRIAAPSEGEVEVVAVTVGEFDAKANRFAVELVPLEIGDASVAAGPSQRLLLDSPPTFDNPSLAPDGRTAVYLQRQWQGGASWEVHAIQLDDGRERKVDSGLANGQQPRLGLLDGGRVLLDDGTGLGRVVDLREREVELMAVRSSPTVSHLEAVFAGGTRAAPAGGWLAVHDLAHDDLRYLGYEAINVTDVGVSPSGATVAWALGDRVAVEAVGTREVVAIPGTAPTGRRFVEFVDEDRLLTLDWTGGAELLGWRDGEVLDAADLGVHPQTAELVRDGSGDALLLVRSNLWQNPAVVEVRAGGFGRRALAHAAANLAGLRRPAGAAIDEWSAWTLDGSGQVREFTVAELGAGVDIEAAAAAGKTGPFGFPQQLAFDGQGRTWWVNGDAGGTPVVHVAGPSGEVEARLSPGPVVSLHPSPDGRRIAIVQQRDTQQLLTVLDAATLDSAWARPLAGVSGLAWSADGDELGVAAAFSGGVVFDAGDGDPLTARCGLAFEVRRTPPMNLGAGAGPNVCDL